MHGERNAVRLNQLHYPSFPTFNPAGRAMSTSFGEKFEKKWSIFQKARLPMGD
jgi:hypothetical protein